MLWKETSTQPSLTGSGSQEFVNSIDSYTTRYQIAEQTYTIPGVFGTDLAAGDWRYRTWWTETGRPYQISTPNVPVSPGTGTWPATADTDSVRYAYDVYGNVLGAGEPVTATLPAANGLNLDPTKLYVNTDTLTDDGLDDLGRTTARLLERSSSSTEVGMLREYTYNAQTGAIDRIVGRWENSASGFQDATYTRDAIGNVTTITDNVTTTATRECFLYDSRNRLVRAHTAAPGVACLDSDTADPLASGSRGVDAYDTRWMFDSINRIDKRIDMLPAGAGTLDYQYDSGHPHAVTGMTDAANQPLADYDYDYNAVGAMTGRRSNAEAEDTLIYDPEQRLTNYNRADSTVDDETYQYWASNQRVVRRAGTTRTITLPGLDIAIQGTTRTITKQITAAGASVATKTIISSASTVYWNCADLQNSATCQAEAGTHATSPTIRRYQPYGTPRNTNTLPNTTRGYLNQPEDPTGLTYLNNRYHDPQLAAFTTVDPLVGKTGQPYLYGNGNPATLSDPSGLEPCGRKYGRCIAPEPLTPKSDGGGGSHGSCGGKNCGATGYPLCGGGSMGFQISCYISYEMGRNRAHPSIAGERANHYNCLFCNEWNYATHLMNMWDLADELAENGPWDHKGPIVTMADAPNSESYLDLGNGLEVRIDVFSNMHYGYVMKHAGLVEADILDYSHGEFGFVVDAGVWINNHIPGRDDIEMPNSGNQTDMANRLQDDASVRLGISLCDCGRGDGGNPPPTAAEIVAAISSSAELMELGLVRASGT